mmetsp:Transcript_30666/g.94746  ORF Transcript_30666/g.94746 Transcript_30666/m.94746 type:complete len:213 (+) Transcript_30666:303-941(+)
MLRMAPTSGALGHVAPRNAAAASATSRPPMLTRSNDATTHPWRTALADAVFGLAAVDDDASRGTARDLDKDGGWANECCRDEVSLQQHFQQPRSVPWCVLRRRPRFLWKHGRIDALTQRPRRECPEAVKVANHAAIDDRRSARRRSSNGGHPVRARGGGALAPLEGVFCELDHVRRVFAADAGKRPVFPDAERGERGLVVGRHVAKIQEQTQ